MNDVNRYTQNSYLTHSTYNINSINRKRVLIVGGDNKSHQITEEILVNEGFDVTLCNDGVKALQQVNRIEYQLILLDIVIPSLNGFELLKILRLNNKAPTMMLSSHYDKLDKIYALEMGADDYLIKPVNRRELLARINSIARRSEMICNFQLEEALKVNDISVGIATREVHCCGVLLNLTGYEFEVLHILILNAGKIVSKDKIGEYVHGRAVPYYDRSIDMHISNIRKKIAAFVITPKIKTVRGAGYVFLQEAL
jgi:two-component system response regulator CpxR